MISVADLVHASSAHLVALNPIRNTVLRDEAFRTDPVMVKQYTETWCTKDILMEPFLRSVVGEPRPDHELVSRRLWERSELFNELARPFDLPNVLPTLLHCSPDKIVALSLKASARQGPFQAPDVRRLKIVVPHIRRALEIKDRLSFTNVRADSLAKSLDSVSFGVIILDATGRILEASAAAEQLINASSGIGKTSDGRIALREPAGSELRRWLLAGSSPLLNTEGLLHVPRCGTSAISVLATRIPLQATSWLSGSPRWMLLLFDPERRIQVSTEVIARDLGLSPREAQVAGLLAAGSDVNASAVTLHISVHTARTHVKAIFSKTGIRSQSELVQRIANGPASICRDDRAPTLNTPTG